MKTDEMAEGTEKVVPFILRFVEPLDQADYDAAVADHDLAMRAYSPQTQTSIAVRAGSSKTYDSTWTGIMFLKTDDSKVSDT